MTTTAIDRITKHAKKIASGKDPKVRPGVPYRISEATDEKEGVWQGDLGIEIIAKITANFIRAEKPSRQLVPGVTQGARHCLDSLSGVELYLPPGWGEAYEGLIGPCLRLTEERTVQHPTHGAVTIPAGFVVQCRYQREYDSELRRERRNAD